MIGRLKCTSALNTALMIDSFKLFRIGVMKIQFLEASAANAMQGGDHCGDLAGCSDWSSDAWLVLVVGRQGYTMHECLSDARCPKERRKFGVAVYNNDTSTILLHYLRASSSSLVCRLR